MKGLIRHIPNFITTLNLLTGTLATFFAIDGHLIWAGILICTAALFDFADGMAAYFLKAWSELGKQLDSLADVVSFGIAPGAILFTLIEFSLFGKNTPIHEISCTWQEWLLLGSAFLIPVFGAIRLARFNINSSNEPFFRGLPIPANGLLWASFGLMIQFPEHESLVKILFSAKNLVILALFISFFMVSTLPMFSLKFKSLGFKENWYRYLFLLISVVLILWLQVYALVFVIFIYIGLNLLFYLLKIEY
jgi:CDP-diacylglycerol--serine O-phosphatidyltransferase